MDMPAISATISRSKSRTRAMIRAAVRIFPACPCGGMVDAADSKSVAGDSVLVQARGTKPVRVLIFCHDNPFLS